MPGNVPLEQFETEQIDMREEILADFTGDAPRVYACRFKGLA